MSDSSKCPMCDEYFDSRDEDEIEDYDSIHQTGRCRGCLEEWGSGWADRNY